MSHGKSAGSTRTLVGSSLYWEVIAMPLMIGGGPIGLLGVIFRLMVCELGNVKDLASIL
jgi:hypothetical protein